MQKGKLCRVKQKNIISIDLNKALMVQQAMKTWTPANDEEMPVSSDIMPCYFAVLLHALIKCSDTFVYLFPDLQAANQ